MAARYLVLLLVAGLIGLVIACAGPVPSLVPLGGVSEPKPPKKRVARAPEKPASAPSSTQDDDDDDDDTAAADADGGAGRTPRPVASAAASAEAAPPAKIDGEYVGLDVAVYRVDSMPDRTERDPKARTLIRTPDDTTAEVVILDSGTGKEICVLEGDRKGNAITLRAGQTCFEQSGGDASTSASIKTGTAAVNDDALIVQLDMDFSLTVGGRTLTGNLDYRFDGKRK